MEVEVEVGEAKNITPEQETWDSVGELSTLGLLTGKEVAN